MKPIFLWALACTLSATGLLAQPLSYHPGVPRLEAFLKIKINRELVSNYQTKNGTAEIDLQTIGEGYQHVATDVSNGRKLYMMVHRSGNQVRVSGFAVRKRTARWINLNAKSSYISKKACDCPEGQNATTVRYTHPTYPSVVSTIRKSPNRLSIVLPTNGL